MRQIILTESATGWSYVVLLDGQPVALDVGPYDTPEDALTDAVACPTPL